MRLAGPFADHAAAWQAADEVVTGCAGEPLDVIGDFVVPPADGPPSRDFQTLHFDFGVPLDPVGPADVARYTALHVLAGAPPSTALTRLVPLRPLLSGRDWPEPEGLVGRLAAYGESHGGRDDVPGYTEGSLARIIEAADDVLPVLPSSRADPGFLCGTEFASLDDEQRFLADHGVDVSAVAIEVCLRPGELLVFDNLAVAHGRRGARSPGELCQRVFGHRGASIERLLGLRSRLLAAFGRPSRTDCTGIAT